MEANIKLQIWYLDFMSAVTKELANSVAEQRLPSDLAVTVAITAIMNTIKYGITVERGSSGGGE